MDINKFFEWKKRRLTSQSGDGNDSKRPHKERNNSTSASGSPGDVFEGSLKWGDSVKIFDNRM